MIVLLNNSPTKIFILSFSKILIMTTKQQDFEKNHQQRIPPQKLKMRFFATGTPELLLRGIDVELDMSFNPTQCKNYLLDQISDELKIQKGDLIVYLAGGIPFLGGTLGDLYLKETEPKVKPHIYGILTSPLANIDITNNYHELCNINDETRKIILSPLSESSLGSLCDIACLLGYLNHDGCHGELFLRAAATLIHFPPLLTCLNRVIDRYEVNGRDVITICSTLFTYFRWMVPQRIKSDEVFGYALRCCNLICHISDIPENLPLSIIETTPNKKSNLNYLNKLKQPRYVYIWRADEVGRKFKITEMKKPEQKDIEESFSKYVYFTPIAPLTIRVATGCSIVRGKDHNFLYLKESSDKDSSNQNSVDIIDPTSGFVDSKDLDEFSREQDDPFNHNNLNLIDPDQVKQVVLVCLDISSEMGKNMENTDLPYSFIIKQCLTIFANRLHGYRIPTILGLVTFNDEIKDRFDMSPFLSDFEKNILNTFKFEGHSNYCKAILNICDDLYQFTRDSEGNLFYKNASTRILLITNHKSKHEIDEEMNDVCLKLFEYKFILDSVILGSYESEKDIDTGLITLSHISFGMSFNPTTITEGIDLFETSSFLDYNDRDVSHHNHPIIGNDRSTHPNKIKLEMIDVDFLQCGSEFASFNKEIRNKFIYRAQNNVRLSTPSHIVYMNRNDQIPNKRFRRILRELYYISQIMDKTDDDYDNDLIIYTYSTNLDNWIVYLKGTDGTIYENKWFELYVSFPDIYPDGPPIVRFISIPYHLNISLEGRMCLNIVEKGYMPALHVYNILQEVKELFLMPNKDSAIQIEILQTYLEDPDLYYKKAKESAETVGKPNYKDFFHKNTYIMDDAEDSNDRISLDCGCGGRTPLFMISQVYGRAIRDPVLASSGVFYERSELIQLVSSSSNPICVITGKELTEKTDEI